MTDKKKTLCIFVRGWADGDEWLVRLASIPHRRKTPDLELGSWPTASLHALLTSQPTLEVRYPAFGRPRHYTPDEKDIALGTPRCDMSLWSADDPAQIAQEVRRTIDHFYDARLHDRIVLIGYSAGGALLRYALMRAHGIACDTAQDAPEMSAWVTDKVPVRAIYLAGILRGWSVSTAMPTYMRILAGPMALLANSGALLRKGRRSFIYQMRHGEPFIVRGRLMQATLRARTDTVDLPFEQINILGSLDNIIAPKDCIELSGTSGQLFVEIPDTDHTEMLQVALPDPERGADETEKEVRGRLILKAVLDRLSDWKQETAYVVDENDINDYFDHLDRPHMVTLDKDGEPAQKTGLSAHVTHAVFVLHGIRDNGHWTKRIARKIKQKANSPLVRAPSPTYGFFNMISFVAPWVRYEKARWFMEEYADVRECYPKANVSFVGHSNGTYLAARAMDECDLVQFKRVVFAGSVVRRRYPWRTRMTKGQVKDHILNLKGTRDWVVLFLPGVTEWWPLKYLDLGGAGFHGFKTEAPEDRITERILDGDHRAGIMERTWQPMADFVVDGDVPDQLEETRSKRWTILGRIAPAVTLMALCGAIFFLWILVCIFAWALSAQMALWLLALISVFVILRLA